MRFFHIITVSEARLYRGLKDRPALEREVGAAVVALCIGPEAPSEGKSEGTCEYRERVAANGLLSYVDEYGERDLAFFATDDGQLRPATVLTNRLLDEGISLLAIYKKHAPDEDTPHS